MITTAGPKSEEHEPLGLLDIHIASFLEHLQAAGYAARTHHKKRPVANAFAHWTRRQRIALHDLTESHIAAFVRRAPRKRNGRAKFEKSVLSLLLKYLRLKAGVQGSPALSTASPLDDLLQRYVGYLRNMRGLAENSVHVYVPFIRDLLRDQMARTGGVSVDAFDAPTIRSFLLNRARDRSSEYGRLLATALRSFFRFLFLQGDLTTDLAASVPPVRRYRHTAVPAVLTSADIDRVLAATDRSSRTGRRDHAMLLLLARLGLRAGEIVTLELDDICWRSGELERLPGVSGQGDVGVERKPLQARAPRFVPVHHRGRRAKPSHRMAGPRTGGH